MGLCWKTAAVSHQSTGNFNDCAGKQKEINAIESLSLSYSCAMEKKGSSFALPLPVHAWNLIPTWDNKAAGALFMGISVSGELTSWICSLLNCKYSTTMHGDYLPYTCAVLFVCQRWVHMQSYLRYILSATSLESPSWPQTPVQLLQHYISIVLSDANNEAISRNSPLLLHIVFLRFWIMHCMKSCFQISLFFNFLCKPYTWCMIKDSFSIIINGIIP